MDAALAMRLRQFFVRAALYALGLIVVLAAVFGVLFTLAKPKLLSLAQAEMRKYGVEAGETDMSLFGYVHMRDLSVPLSDGGRLRAAELSVRPPLHFLGQTWLSGAGALYNLRAEKNGMSVFIPELHFNGASLEEKDASLGSHSLQMLMRLRLGSLYADKIALTFAPAKAESGKAGEAEKPQNSAAPQAVINGFGISGLSGGKIAAVSFSGMDSGFSLPAAKAAGEDKAGAGKISHMRSGAFLARDIDAGLLYALARSLAPSAANSAAKIPFPRGKADLAGIIRLYNIDIEAEDEKFGTIRLAADELTSRSLALKGDKTEADFILQMPAGGEAAEQNNEKKRILLHNLRSLLSDMASVDISAQNAMLEIEPRPEILAAAEAARRAQALSAAQAADKHKTVRDILDEEQEQAERGQSAADASQAAHLPLQFKLKLSSFALKANHWQQAIPHDFYVKLKDFAFIPGKNRNELLQALHDMGHDNLQFSLLGDIGWNPDNSDLTIKHLAFYGRDMGGFSLQGKLLDVPQAVFDGKPEAINRALNEAGIGDMEMRLADSGFIKNLVQWGTTQINISAAELQTDLHDIAVKSPPLLLKNRKEAQNFSDVFGAFVRDSGTIRIKMSAPQQGGLKLHDIMASQDDLSALLDRLQLSAERLSAEPLPELTE